MPHLVLQCSRELLNLYSGTELCEKAHQAALSTDQFQKQAIRVRLLVSEFYLVGGAPCDYLHIDVFILQGRPLALQKRISETIRNQLLSNFPKIPSLSVDILERNPDIYCK